MPRVIVPALIASLATACFSPGPIVLDGTSGSDDGGTTGGSDGIVDGSSGVATAVVDSGGPSGCGNGTLDDGEECDLGANNADNGGCTSTCTLATCGDGLVYIGEEDCDDGIESSRCDADCTSVMCGDGVVNGSAGEQCDDAGESATCDADCTPAECGDGVTNATAAEECDDAGESATCDSDCTEAICGDGQVNPTAGETCDDGGPSPMCGSDCNPPPCPPGSARGYPVEVLECGPGFLDEDQHPVGSEFSVLPDDLRTGSCSPTPCVTGGQTVLGVDLEFDLPVPQCAVITSATMTVRGIPNNGDPGTTEIYDYETGALMGSCLIDEVNQAYGECEATLDPSFLENGLTRVYTDNNDPACYFVYDFFELEVSW